MVVQTLHASQTDPQRVVLLHGFTQNSACWEPFAGLVATLTGMEVVAVDAPGHGRSPAVHDRADLWESAQLIGAAAGTGHYVGYSMGGRTAVHLALAMPELVRSLTLIGATPGIADPAERSRRLTADHALADQLETIGVEPFVDRWLAQPLFAKLQPEAAHREARLLNRVDGLAASLRHCGTGTQQDLRPQLLRITAPTMVVAGAEDAKFAAIGRELPGHLQLISGAGHSAHLEQPDVTARLVAEFLAATTIG